MTKYARITSSTRAIIEEKDESKFRGGKPPPANTAKDWEWLPVTVEKPSYNIKTEVLEGPKDVVTAEKITRKWTVAKLSDKEIQDRKDLQIPSTDSVQYKIMFDQENRVRKLEGLSATTHDEFRVLLRSKV
jgi:hypothetical protein